MTTARDTIDDMLTLLKGQPVFLCGSLVAEDEYGLTDAHSDVDLFCPTGNVLVATTQFLLGHGYKLDDRMERTWYRWLRFGFKTWHTNSLRLMSPGGVETNLVYKLTEGHATTSLAQVLESFDFGLLGVGYDVETGVRRDLRPYLFPQFHGLHWVRNGPLPMMPNKREAWRNGFISQYNGLREFGRYAKYHEYGYDMSLVKDDLATGYAEAALYMMNHFDADKQQQGLIYQTIGLKIEDDKIDELFAAAKQIDFKDSLDAIMEALE
jgi:hypothetical protein